MTAAITPPAAFVWTRRHVLALVVLCLAALLDTIDVTVVNVAMPAIKESLHFSESGLAWMVDARTWCRSAGSCCSAGGPGTSSGGGVCLLPGRCCSPRRRLARRWHRRHP